MLHLIQLSFVLKTKDGFPMLLLRLVGESGKECSLVGSGVQLVGSGVQLVNVVCLFVCLAPTVAVRAGCR